MSNYPSQIDDDNSLPVVSPEYKEASYDIINKLTESIISIQLAIGADPLQNGKFPYPTSTSITSSGDLVPTYESYSNLKERMDILGKISISSDLSLSFSNIKNRSVKQSDLSFINANRSSITNQSSPSIGDNIYISDISFGSAAKNYIVSSNIIAVNKISGDISANSIYVDDETFKSPTVDIKDTLFVKNRLFLGSTYDLLNLGVLPIKNEFNGYIGYDGKIEKIVVCEDSSVFKTIDIANQINSPGGDVSGNASAQTVIGINEIPISQTTPTANKTLMFDGSKFISSNDFGSNTIQTSGSLVVGSIRLTSLVGDNTVKSTDLGLEVGFINNDDVDDNAKIDGAKVVPNFGNQDLVTLGQIYSNDGYLFANAINLGMNFQAKIYSGNGLPPEKSNRGSIFISKNGSVYLSNGAHWSLPVSSPSSTAGSSKDLSGVYPNPVVEKINGARVPAASANLKAGNILFVKSNDSIEYGPLKLDGGSNYVVGALPDKNQARQKMGGDVAGDTSNNKIIAIQSYKLNSSLYLPKNNDLFYYDGQTWAAKDPVQSMQMQPVGKAGGDLDGYYEYLPPTKNGPKVIKIHGANIDKITTQKNGNILQIGPNKSLIYSAIRLDAIGRSVTGVLPSINQEPQSLLGDLVGTTDNVSFSSLNGRQIFNDASNKPNSGDVFGFDGQKWVGMPRPILNNISDIMINGVNDLSGTYKYPNVNKVNGSKVQKIDRFSKPNQVLQIKANSSGKELVYDKIDLNKNTFIGKVKRGRLVPQILGKDLSGTTVKNSVVGIYGSSIPVPNITNQLSFIKFGNQNSASYSKITLNECDGYLILKSQSNMTTSGQNSGKIYFDGASKKIMVSEGGRNYVSITDKKSNIRNIKNITVQYKEDGSVDDIEISDSDDFIILNSGSAQQFGQNTKFNIYLPVSNLCQDGKIITIHVNDSACDFNLFAKRGFSDKIATKNIISKKTINIVLKKKDLVGNRLPTWFYFC